jgi:hypothetical protein
MVIVTQELFVSLFFSFLQKENGREITERSKLRR